MEKTLERRHLGAWAVREVVNAHLARIQPAFDAASVPWVVLKGAWLQAVYEDPDERPFGDLDLAVDAARMGDVRAILAGLGFESSPPAPGIPAQLFRGSGRSVAIDVHTELFPACLFGLSAADVIARAEYLHIDGVGRVPVPNALDGYAHLVGHFIKGRMTAEDIHHARDFATLATRCRLDPRAIGEHLDRHGLGRAARYALRQAERAAPHEHHASVLATLEPDRVGDRLAMLDPRRMGRFEAGFAFALEANLGSALLALVRHGRATGLARAAQVVLRDSRQ